MIYMQEYVQISFTVNCNGGVWREPEGEGTRAQGPEKDSKKEREEGGKKNEGKEKKLGTSAAHCHVGRLTSSL